MTPGPGIEPGSGWSLLLVVCSAPRGFSPGTPVFPFPQKPTFQFDPDYYEALYHEPLARVIAQALPVSDDPRHPLMYTVTLNENNAAI